MTGKFNETTRRLLRDANGGGLDNRALFDLMVAGHEEGLLAAEKLAEETKEAAAALAATLAQDRQCIDRIASHLESEAGTINRAMQLHCADTNAHRRDPRRRDDPPEYDYSGIIMGRYATAGGEVEDRVEDREMGDLKRFWRVTRWAGLVVGAALLVALADVVVRLIFGM